MKGIRLEVTELEARIAPDVLSVTVENPGVTASGTLNTDDGTASGTLTINQTEETLSGELTFPTGSA